MKSRLVSERSPRRHWERPEAWLQEALPQEASLPVASIQEASIQEAWTACGLQVCQRPAEGLVYVPPERPAEASVSCQSVRPFQGEELAYDQRACWNRCQT